jgi:predicted nucleotidyltransferase
MSQPPHVTIFETVHGSRAYGLGTPTSDTDVKGIIVGPPRWYFGPSAAPEQIELSADHVRYEVRKFFRLAAAANPTVLELLWTAPEHHRTVTPEGARLLAARELFLSARVAETFGGYALSQLKRIRTHRRWLLEPPAQAPRRPDFDLPPRPAVTRDQLGAAEAMLDDGRLHPAQLPTNFLAILDAERRYRAAQREWEQFCHWESHRNPARAALERQHGYDTKHALHLVRLLRMGREILEIGRLVVTRPDREELLAIRAGAWTFDQLIDRAEAAHAAIADARRRTSLPDDVDTEAIEGLCTDLVASALERVHD